MIKLDNKELNSIVKEYIHTKINPDFSPEIVVGIKTAGDVVGKIVYETFLELNKNPHYESIKFQRSTTNIKDKYLRDLLKKLPEKILHVLRKIEFNIYIKFSSSSKKSNSLKKSDKSGKKILLVDDSVDTGRTIVKAKNYLLNKYSNADIRVFSIAQTTVDPVDYPDYVIYNEMIIGPWSIDFKEKK